jgi:hypothetical protein
MAKKKTRILWLSKDRMGYCLSKDKMEYDEASDWFDDDVVNGVNFCATTFESFCPSLRLPMNIQRKLKLTQLKNGIKLEKVK